MAVTDFDAKVAVVVRDDLAIWQRLNVTAFLMSGVTARAGAEAIGEPYQATMSISPGEAVAQPRASVPNGVIVGTYTSAGAAADRAFHLAVFC